MIKYIKQLQEVAHTAKVFPGLNAVKGILIILVIFTHSLPDGMLLYFNYFFHMPVFLAVSGYLLKVSAFKNGIVAYFQRLFHRLIIPWIIATICYLPYSLKGRSITTFNLTDLLYPYFHLWYVPAYVIGVLLCYSVIKFKIPALLMLILTGAFTVIWYNVYRATDLTIEQQPLYFLGEKRFYAYLVFFFLGFSLRNELIKVKFPAFLLFGVVAVSFTTSVFLVYGHAPDYVVVIPYMFFNICLVLFLLLYFAPLEWFQYKLILLINKQSLGFYLYHPMVVFTIYQLIGDPEKHHSNNLVGFLVGLCTLIIMLVAIWLVQKWRVSNRFLLGITEEK